MYVHIYIRHHDTTTVPWEEHSSTIKPTHYWVLLFVVGVGDEEGEEGLAICLRMWLGCDFGYMLINGL